MWWSKTEGLRSGLVSTCGLISGSISVTNLSVGQLKIMIVAIRGAVIKV